MPAAKSEADPSDQFDSSTADDERSQLKEIIDELIALREYAAHFVAAGIAETGLRIDQFVKRLAYKCFLGMLVVAMALTCVIYVARGTSGGLGALFGHAWLGQLMTGVLGLSAIAFAAKIHQIRTARHRLAKCQEKFEQRKARQDARIGRDVEDAQKAAA